MTITFTVPGLPRPWKRQKNRFIRKGAGGFISSYMNPKTREAEDTFIARAIAHKPETPIAGPVALDLLFVLPIPKSESKRFHADCAMREVPHTKTPDMDNLEKLVADALNGVFWLDDKQVCRVTKRKIYGTIPRTEVRIEEL